MKNKLKWRDKKECESDIETFDLLDLSGTEDKMYDSLNRFILILIIQMISFLRIEIQIYSHVVSKNTITGWTG